MIQIRLGAVDALVELSQQPLKNRELENLPRNDAPERINYYRFLYHCVQTFQPDITLEIGVERGYASAFMVVAAQDYGGLVVGIDLNKRAKIGRETIILGQLPARFGDYIFIPGDAANQKVVDQVETLTRLRGKIGLVFQDSSHHYEASRQEWQRYSPLLDRPALWLCDDITPAFHDPVVDPPGLGMVQYFEELPGEKKLYPDVLHRGNTQGVVIISC